MNEIKNPIKIQEKVIKDAAELYVKDNKKGSLINNVLNVAHDLNKESYNRLVKIIKHIDNKLFNKNDLIQKFMLNRILVTHVLKIRNEIDNDFNSILAILSYKLSNKEWKKIVTKHILPTLINNKYL